MRIRLTSWPKPGELDEFDFSRFRLGEIYDLPLQFASVLLISGYAELPPPQQQDRGIAADKGAPKRRKPEPEF